MAAPTPTPINTFPVIELFSCSFVIDPTAPSFLIVSAQRANPMLRPSAKVTPGTKLAFPGYWAVPNLR
jgi:hypothetical protein